MNISYEIVEMIANYIELFLLYRIYAHLFYRFKRRKTLKYEVLFAILGTLILEACDSYSIFANFMIWIFVLYISVTAVALYKINYIFFFSISSFYKICVIWIDLLIHTIALNQYAEYIDAMEITSDIHMFSVIITLGIKCMWILLYLILRKYFDRISFDLDYNRMLLLIAVFGFLGYYYLFVQLSEGSGSISSQITFFLVFFTGLIIFGCCFFLEREREKQKLEYFKMRNHLLEESYKAIHDVYTKNARLYHDLNNHLNALYQLLNLEKTTEAKAYIQEISHPIMQLAKKVWTGVDVVDVILNSKLESAQEKGIEIEYHVEFPSNTNIHAYDICIILSNLLDNAIEATEKIDGRKKITLVIRKINYFMIIRVSNPCLKMEQQFLELPITTKANKHLHGWGLSSVKEAVEKYNGTIKCVNEKGKFIATIMLFYGKI